MILYINTIVRLSHATFRTARLLKCRQSAFIGRVRTNKMAYGGVELALAVGRRLSRNVF